MFKGAYQRKLLTIFSSGGSNPLEIWDIKVQNGWTRRLKDDDLGCIVFEVAGTNVATAYVVSPPDPRGSLAISLPFFTMLVKNLKRYFTFEIQIIDDKQMRRRFRFSNYQSCTKVRPFACSVPLALKPGWNQLQLNLANFTTRAYGTNYVETQRVQIHANCRVRRVYFSDRIYAEEDLPKDYRIMGTLRRPSAVGQRSSADLAPPPPATTSAAAAPPVPPVHSHTSFGARASKGEVSVPSETLVAETSFKSADKRSGRSVSVASRSVGAVSAQGAVSATASGADSAHGVASAAASAAVSAHSRASGDLRTASVHVGASGDLRTASVTSAASKRSQRLSQSKIVTFDEALAESPEEAGEPLEGPAVGLEEETPLEEAPENAALPVVEEEDAVDDSPRPDPPESEYTESEPPLESDVEDATATDEPPTTDNESPDESP